MLLKLGDGNVIENPDEAAVEEAVRRLGPASAFVTLDPGDDEDAFLMAAGVRAPFTVEHYDSGKTVRRKIDSKERIVEIFKGYLAGDTSRLRGRGWEKVAWGPSRRTVAGLVIVGIIDIVVAAFLIWRLL